MSTKKLIGFTDDALLVLLMKGDMSAFEETYNRYWRRLYSMAYKRIRIKEIAEELVQDIFTSLWINRSKVNVESLSAYLLTAMKYKVINYLRHEMVKSMYVRQEVDLTSVLDNSTEENVLLHDLEVALDQEITKLPAGCQTVFKLSRQQNLSMKQVANQLGISEKTVENQLGKANKVLRANLRHFAPLISIILSSVNFW